MSRFSRADLGVLAFTLAYSAIFAGLIWWRGNTEFLVYAGTMAVLIALVGATRFSAAYPVSMLWALTLWGLAHMAGGNLIVRGDVLYNLTLWHLTGEGEWTILKYDQAVHAWGFGVTAWLLWHILVTSHPGTRGSRIATVYPVIGAMGLGALNEMIEFTAVALTPNTNVGGYVNNALDLVFNAAGAVIAMVLIRLFSSRVSPR
jgi:putative membrane protein